MSRLTSSPEELLEKYQTQLVIQGQTWNVFDKGSGTPIIFLHNGGGTLWNWAHQLQHFSSNHRIIAPDLPGFGHSHRPFEPLTLRECFITLKIVISSASEKSSLRKSKISPR